KLAEVIKSGGFDAVHVQHLRMSPYMADYQHIPRILDMPDAFSMYWERRKNAAKNPLRKIFNGIEHKRLLRYEPIMKEYNLSLVCSDEDREYLVQHYGINNISVLPNGVDLDLFSPKDHDYIHNNTLLFTGNMDYAPNVD